ncbi:MAG: sensor histidine kinase [Actinomycetota bacterium]|nr:sensor histidine kinase [Actinomycetota bacterium]
MSSSADRTDTRRARWPWLVLAIFFTIAMVGAAFVVANHEPISEQVPYIVAFSLFGVVGSVIVSRDRRNVIGLMLLYASLFTAASFLAGELFTWLLVRGHAGPFVVFLGLMNNFGWLLGILPVIFILPLLFPDGHLPSPRWRPLLWGTIAFLAAVGVTLIFGQPRLTGSNENIDVANPFFVHRVILDSVIGLLFPVVFLASVGSLFQRFRRSAGIERQQIKWVAFGLAFAFVTIIVGGFVLSGSGVLAAVVAGAGFLAFPVSIGVAVLRFRLYDLDVVVRKTVVAGVLAVFVGVVYAAFVAAGSLLVGSNDTTIAVVAAVVLALAFQPVRIRARRFADRLVYGRRANPYEVLTEFSSRVGGAYATEDVVPRMAQILGEGAGAKVARVWLRAGRELRPSASWPSDAAVSPNVAIDGDVVPSIPGAYAAAVRDRGELLGALSVEMPASDPMTPDKERLVADLASQAGLVLRNVALVEELRESRRRLVAAQDHERRKLERNIHDGAQQQLVALAVKARLARQFVARDPAKTEEMLGQIEAETQAALDDLRDLARGIYPPLLADKGLGSALDAQARKAPFPVRVDADGVGRLPQDVEAAVYFSCLEALQNVAKYAGASEAAITITRAPTVLTFVIADDGRGFDPTTVGSGGGLEGVADRLAAIGGTFVLRSAPGAGTTISGTVPVTLVPSDAPTDPSAPGAERVSV